MTNEELRSFVDRFGAAWESQNVPALMERYAEDCVVVSPIFSTLTGRAPVEQSYRDLVKAFAAQTIKVEDIVIGNDDPPRAVIVRNIHPSIPAM